MHTKVCALAAARLLLFNATFRRVGTASMCSQVWKPLIPRCIITLKEGSRFTSALRMSTGAIPNVSATLSMSVSPTRSWMDGRSMDSARGRRAGPRHNEFLTASTQGQKSRKLARALRWVLSELLGQCGCKEALDRLRAQPERRTSRTLVMWDRRFPSIRPVFARVCDAVGKFHRPLDPLATDRRTRQVLVICDRRFPNSKPVR